MKVMVLGLGLSGISAAKLSMSLGHATSGTDQLPFRSLPAGVRDLQGNGFKFMDEENAMEAIRDFDLLVISPGVPPGNNLVMKARSLGVEVIGEVEWAFRNCKGRIVGITGSNGKSTTTALAASLLKACGFDARLGGNIGIPFSGLVEGAGEGTIFVLELSSFQLETVADFRADIAVLLNVTPDHQDRYAGIEDYARAKARVFERQDGNCAAILNIDDPFAVEAAKTTEGERYFFSLKRHEERGAFLAGRDVMYRNDSGDVSTLFSAAELSIKGPHNLENAMAASMAALLCGGTAKKIREALPSFPALPHRLELVSDRRGVKVYNDSKATNTDSVLKALASFDGRIILLLGGKDKGADFTLLLPGIRERCRKVVAFGAAAGKVVEQIGKETGAIAFGTLKEATRFAISSAEQGDIVLLSPACASFDEFRNFEDRGDRFREYVLEATDR